MSQKDRRRVLLALLVVIAAIVGWRQFGPWLTGSAGMAGGAASSLAAAGGGSDSMGRLPKVEELRLADLRAVSGELSAGRNPFEVERPVSPPPPRPSATDLRAALKREREKEPPKEVVRSEPGAPTPPPVDVVFLGSFGPANRRLAVFSDGSDIYNALEGEVLKDKFVVVRIGLESADLGFVGFPAVPTQRLEIGG